MRGVAAICLCLAGPALATQEVLAPSGQSVVLIEALAEEQPYSDEVFLVLRVLAPGLSQVDADSAQADLDWACDHFAPDRAGQMTEMPDEIVVQLMESEVPRGQTVAGVTQFFGGYALEEGGCVPLGF